MSEADPTLKGIDDLVERYMTDTKQKPDGWVAWHPKEGTNTSLYGWMGDRSDLVMALCIELDLVDYDHCGSKFPLVSAMGEKGWRIRPVKLVFLDEGEK